MKKTLLAALVALGLFLMGCSQNRANPKDDNDNRAATSNDNQRDGGASDKLSPQDEEFAQKAATGGQAEVEMAKMAMDRASRDEVKQFAQRLISDHQQANQQLDSIASRKDLDLPKMMPTEAQEAHDKMMKLSGAAFDKAFLQHAVQDHQKDIAEFQKAATSVSDNDLKQFASQTLPTLQEHLRMAQDLGGGKSK
jgi:putative membrane protein